MIDLSREEASELADLLDSAIADLSPEIAATDNPDFRASLRVRRQRLQAVRGKLG